VSDPFFSVIIPVYNRVSLLERAIHSVLSQSFTNYELVVVDDGSTHSLVAQEDLVKKHGGTFIRQQHSGVSAARNCGFSSSRGTWIALLDSDDIWHPDKLANDKAFIEENTNIQIFQCPEIWYRNGKRVNPKEVHRVRSGDIYEHSLDVSTISSSACVIYRSVLEQVGAWDVRFPVCEDYDLWLRITARFSVGLLPTTQVTKYKGHEDQLSNAFQAMDRFRVAALLKLILSTDLTTAQTEQATSALLRKATVLLKGAGKRGKKDDEDLYRDLIKITETHCHEIDWRERASRALDNLFAWLEKSCVHETALSHKIATNS
jgi:glycosyltransferase involved in cell wall biosynthesis